MPARTTPFLADSYYHVYNRGSEKRTIFLSHWDYIKFLGRIKENAKKYATNILCYTLMPNHFHFLLHQTKKEGICEFMNSIQLGHAKFFNIKYERVGPLYQGRFKAKLINKDEYLLQVSAYIHRNIIAHFLDSGSPNDSRNLTFIREKLRSYPYSSYRGYIGLEHNGFIESDTILNYFSTTNAKLTYESFVENFIPDLEALTPILAAY